MVRQRSNGITRYFRNSNFFALAAYNFFKFLLSQTINKDNLVDIEKAINEAGLGLNPTNDGQVIRISIPQLNEERRADLVKVLGKYSEEARVQIRQAREEAWDEIQEQVKEGNLGEDGKFG